MQTAFVADKKLGLKLIQSLMHWHKQSLLNTFQVQPSKHHETQRTFNDHNKAVYAAQQLITRIKRLFFLISL